MVSKENTVYQSVLICDSFHNYFGPIGEHYPSCLVPLINRPVIEYALDSLRVSGIQEVYIFASTHADLIRSYVNKHWTPQCNEDFNIFVYSSDHYFSLGEILRDLFSKAVIRNDFVLIYGDTVCNLPFKQYLDDFKALRLKDKLCVMAHLFRLSSPLHRTRRKDDESIAVLQASDKRLLCYEKIHLKKIDLDLLLFQNNKDVEVHFDLQDTHISICSLSVLSLFADNFDYQTRDDFIKGIMGQEEILGNTIYAKILDSPYYAARAVSPIAYDAISRDILQRWTYPNVPDLLMNYAYLRNHIYKEGISNITAGSILSRNIAIGDKTEIGANVEIHYSVLGSNVRIGNNVRIEGAYIWDNVIIEDNCTIKTSIIGKNVIIKASTNINNGCLIADNVILGPNVNIKEISYIDSKHRDEDDPGILEVLQQIDAKNLGESAKGFVWIDDGREDGQEESDGGSFSPEIWGLPPDESEQGISSASSSENEQSDDEYEYDYKFGDGDDGDDQKRYYAEVVDSLIRGIECKIACENLIVEINASKHAYNIQYKDVAFLVSRAIIDAVSKLANQEGKATAGKIKEMVKHLSPLYVNYIRDDQGKIDCLKAMEEFTVSVMNQSSSIPILVHFISYLYDDSVLDEDTIIRWHQRMEILYSPVSEIDQYVIEQKSLRSHAIMLKFIEWLKTAEEESESD
ncbi:translation initiation factor eIF-2B subunit epsilon [Tetranychus urticae]|uniref:Translation initiation factor eIF2B subunit epsilon n=1 Tax=Tetranychus urticae TaxID=32264 RepID=T1KXJ1_TETUR|nr:translation initiation factor eIF-2B subunit epsilon [Tetranychus urticae]